MSRINGFIGRRNFLKLTGLSGLSVTTITACNQIVPEPKERAIVDADKANKSNSVKSEEAIKRLVAGNQRFVNQRPLYFKQSRQRLRSVATAQYPLAAILSCADSRIPPEIIFDQGLGNLFVVRVAGNVASEMIVGSLEYSTSVLGANLIVVLGHERCAAVTEAINNQSLPGRIGLITEEIKPALNNIQSRSGDINRNAVIANIRYQVEKLQEKSELISQSVQNNNLKIVGAFYDLDTGKVDFLE
jgi:carbonic anhydrase